jgi:hypothetical protein
VWQRVLQLFTGILALVLPRLNIGSSYLFMLQYTCHTMYFVSLCLLSPYASLWLLYTASHLHYTNTCNKYVVLYFHYFTAFISYSELLPMLTETTFMHKTFLHKISLSIRPAVLFLTGAASSFDESTYMPVLFSPRTASDESYPYHGASSRWQHPCT